MSRTFISSSGFFLTEKLSIENQVELCKDCRTNFELVEYSGSDKKYYKVPRNWAIKNIDNKPKVILGCGHDCDFGVKLLDESIKLYDYQEKAINSVLESYKTEYGGVLHLPTGSGKTVIAIEIIRRLKKKTLVIVSTEALQIQWYREIKRFLGETTEISVLVRNSLMSIKGHQRKYKSSDFKDVGLVIIDEIHTYLGKKEITILDLVSRRYILGLSATLHKKNCIEYLISWYIGDIVYSFIKSYEGASPIVHMVYHKPSKKYAEVLNGINGMTNYTKTIMNILRDPDRLLLVTNIIKEEMSNPDTKIILVICTYKETIDLLFDALSGKVQKFYSGENLKISQDTKVILAVTALAATALDIPQCNCLVLVSPPPLAKDIFENINTTELDQVTGRCLRRKWEKSPNIYVINDNFSYFYKHSEGRKYYYESLLGYKII